MPRAKARPPLTEAEQRLAHDHRGLVFAAVRRFLARHPKYRYQEDDLMGEGLLQFCRAVQTYDPDKARLSTYGYKIITRLCRVLAGEHVVRMPNYQAKNRRKLAKAYPLPERYDWPEPKAEEEPEEDASTSDLEEAMECLSEFEREVVGARFGLGGGKKLSRSKLARRTGASESRLRTVERRAMEKLRERLTAVPD